MRAEHSGAFRLRPVHDGADPFNRLPGCLRIRAHRRRAEGADPEFPEAPAHLPDRFLALHGVVPGKGVNVNVDKPRHQEIPAKVHGFFSRFRLKIPSGSGNPAVPDAHPGFLFKIASIKYRRVPDQHGVVSRLLFFFSVNSLLHLPALFK